MIINGNKRNRDVHVPLKCGTGGELRVNMNQHTEGRHRGSCMLPVCYFTQEERDSGKEEENEILGNHPQEGMGQRHNPSAVNVRLISLGHFRQFI